MGRRPKLKGERVNGMLLLDKPAGISSNRALQISKKLLNAQKAGHTGSLDPIATGLLPLCFGQATRVSEYFLDSDKRYTVTIQLGVTTDSGDSEGNVIAMAALDFDEGKLHDVLQHFQGEMQQVPPMHSAIKRNGQPLYKLARQGVRIERQPRTVIIYALKRLEFQGDKLKLDVTCSKGFYIRSLAEDIGAALGCGGHVIQLRRTQVSSFTLDQSLTLEQLESVETSMLRQKLLLPLDAGLGHMPRITVSKGQANALMQGQKIEFEVVAKADFRIYIADNTFLGIGNVDAAGLIRPKKLFFCDRFAKD